MAANANAPTEGDRRSDATACQGTGDRFEALMAAAGRDVANSRPVIALVRADGRVGRAFERALSASGLTEPQFNVLMELAANDGRLPQCELARGLLRSPANVTALIDRMERDGFVRRVRGEQDRRTVLSEITEAGWDALGAATPAVFGIEREILRGLSASERTQLATLLDHVAPEPGESD